MPIQKRLDFSDLVLADALPALELVVMDQFDRIPMQHEEIMQVGEMSGAITQSSQVSGFPTIGSVGEGAEYPQDKMYQGYDVTFTASKFGVITPISQEAIDDQNVDVFSARPAMLADAMNERIKIDAASIFNNAFSTTLGDGKVLCATDHPLVYPGMGTSANTPASQVDLSIAELKNLLTLYRQQKDMSGKLISARPTHLVVGPSLEFLAHELLESEMLPEGNNNNVNSVKTRYGLKVHVMDHLSDSDAWFLVNAQKNQLRWYWRKRPMTSSDAEFKSDVGLLKISSRYAFGVADWRHVVGTSGA